MCVCCTATTPPPRLPRCWPSSVVRPDGDVRGLIVAIDVLCWLDTRNGGAPVDGLPWSPDSGAPSDAALMLHYFCVLMDAQLAALGGSRGASALRFGTDGRGGTTTTRGFATNHLYIGQGPPPGKAPPAVFHRAMRHLRCARLRCGAKHSGILSAVSCSGVQWRSTA